jgi:hypothetical protein
LVKTNLFATPLFKAAPDLDGCGVPRCRLQNVWRRNMDTRHTMGIDNPVNPYLPPFWARAMGDFMKALLLWRLAFLNFLRLALAPLLHTL